MSGLCPALVGGDGLRQAFEAVVQSIEALDDLLRLDVHLADLPEFRIVRDDDVRHHAVVDLVVCLDLLRRRLLLDGGVASGGEEAEERRDPEPVVERDRVSEQTHRFLSFSLKAILLRGSTRHQLRRSAYLLMFLNQL